MCANYLTRVYTRADALGVNGALRLNIDSGWRIAIGIKSMNYRFGSNNFHRATNCVQLRNRGIYYDKNSFIPLFNTILLCVKTAFCIIVRRFTTCMIAPQFLVLFIQKTKLDLYSAPLREARL